jgi:predicted  nucleic acid-binding Zn-ribbon protein
VGIVSKSAQTLYRLQLLDTELAEQRAKLREAESQLGESQELVAARTADSQAQSELAEWATRLKSLEIDLQILSDRLRASEQRLYSGQVTNAKEVGAMQKDHEQWKRSRTRLEDEVLTAMTRLEDCELTAGEARRRLTGIEAHWQTAQEKLSGDVAKLQARIAALLEKRAPVTGGISPADLVAYEDLWKKKGGRAVVLLVGSMCQGCRVTLPSGKVQLVRQATDLVLCTNCGRILVPEP